MLRSSPRLSRMCCPLTVRTAWGIVVREMGSSHALLTRARLSPEILSSSFFEMLAVVKEVFLVAHFVARGSGPVPRAGARRERTRPGTRAGRTNFAA